jgi:hypothetical protein
MQRESKDTTLNRIKRLYELFHEGAIPTLAVHEVHPELDRASRENYLYFTLPVCLNFQRSSPAMWRSALATFNDPETNYLFFPEKAAGHQREQIQKDLAKHRLALQPNRHTDIWIAISETLYRHFNSDPRQLLALAGFNVSHIISLIQLEMRESFPYLRGTKLSNYWLLILSKFTDVQLHNMQQLSIIPDTHVIKSTVHLGLAPQKVTPEKVANIWQELLANSEIRPVDMHSVLWNWSRANFQPTV